MEVEYRTTCGNAAGHPEFLVRYQSGAITDLAAPAFLEWLESRIAAGERFRDGESLQFGWMFMQIIRRPDGHLGILEPDFVKTPLKWTEDVSRALSHAWLQKEVCRSVGLVDEMAFPSYRQSAVVCKALVGASTIVMDRDEARVQDSGWFVGCDDEGHDHNNPAELRRISLYEAAVQNDRCIPYMALPERSSVRAGSDTVSIFRDGVELSAGTDRS